MHSVHIRPLEKNDAYASVKWRNQPDLWIHTKFKAVHEITIEDELAWIEKVMSDSSSARFAIVADGVYVGNIYLTNIHQGVGEYHIFIGDKNYWGKGIARQASIQIIDHGKNILGLKTIKLEVRSENAAAYHLYKSLGFKEVGNSEDGYVLMELDGENWINDSHKEKNNEAKG